MKGFYIKNVDGKGAFADFLSTKQVRDFFLDFVETLAEIDDNYAEILTDIFEDMYNKLTCVKTFSPETMAGLEDDIDIFKNLIWELFICVIAYMRHIEDYKSINVMITCTYFLETSLLGGQIRPTNYTAFRHYSRLIEESYKPTTEMKNKFTLRGDVISNQREKLPIYSKSSIAGADLFLYQICNAFSLVEDENCKRLTYWFPTFYVYSENVPMEWSKMKSKRYCKKMFELFGVSSIEELKEVLKTCTFDSEMRYNGSFDSATAILDYINIDEIGCLN
jgi:hypothetical protein